MLLPASLLALLLLLLLLPLNQPFLNLPVPFLSFGFGSGLGLKLRLAGLMLGLPSFVLYAWWDAVILCGEDVVVVLLSLLRPLLVIVGLLWCCFSC